jgi:hypothetical protein
MPVFSQLLTDEANLILTALQYDPSSNIIPTILRQCTSRKVFRIGLEDESIWPLIANHMEVISRKPPRVNIFTPQCMCLPPLLSAMLIRLQTTVLAFPWSCGILPWNTSI